MSRPKGSKNKSPANANDKVEAENRDNPLTQAARGRDKSGVNDDETAPKSLKDMFKNRTTERTYKHPKS